MRIPLRNNDREAGQVGVGVGGTHRTARVPTVPSHPTGMMAVMAEHWTDREITAETFYDEDFRELRTERVVFTECDFSGANLTESLHIGSAFRNCTFRRTSLWHSEFRQCSLLGSTFTDCRVRPSKFIETDFTLSSLGGLDLREMDLSDCRFRETNLVGTDMRKANLHGADLTGARTQNLKLDGADLRGARIDPTLWTTATLIAAKVDLPQAVAYAAGHGLDVHGG